MNAVCFHRTHLKKGSIMYALFRNNPNNSLIAWQNVKKPTQLLRILFYPLQSTWPESSTAQIWCKSVKKILISSDTIWRRIRDISADVKPSENYSLQLDESTVLFSSVLVEPHCDVYSFNSCAIFHIECTICNSILVSVFVLFVRIMCMHL